MEGRWNVKNLEGQRISRGKIPLSWPCLTREPDKKDERGLRAARMRVLVACMYIECLLLKYSLYPIPSDRMPVN